MTLYKHIKYSEKLLKIAEKIENSELNEELNQYILANKDPFKIPLKKYDGIYFVQLNRRNNESSKFEIIFVPINQFL